MRPNWIVAMLIGFGFGFVVHKAISVPGAKPGAPVVARANPSAADAQRQRPPPDTTVYKVAIDDSPVKGSPDALVTLVEFSDYQCPYCGRANGTVSQLQGDYGDKLRVVMKQFPLSFHPNAKPAALAALAAREQGKFWEMHEQLFANQKQLDAQTLESLARKVGLDVDKWKSAMADPKLQKIVDTEQAQGSSLGVSGTPAFFINGRKMVGAQPADAFKSLIDEEIKKAQVLTSSGVKPSDIYGRIMSTAVAAAPAPTPGGPPGGPVVKKVDFPADSPAFGPKFAKVTIVEWSDFQCPFCSRVAPTVKQIKETYGKDVKFVFRNEPLPFHNNARPAAQAAMAAHQQGKFWEMHDKLFQNQGALDRPHLEQYAQELGLNVGKFKADMDGDTVKSKIDADQAAAQSVGADGTPNFFVNGINIVGAQPFERFKSVIDEQIQKANKLLASGVKMDQLYERITSNEPMPTAIAAPSAMRGKPLVRAKSL